MKKAKRFLALLLAAAMLTVSAAGCSPAQTSSEQASSAASEETSSVEETSSEEIESSSETVEKTEIRIAGLKGPTGFGMVKLMDDAENGTTANDYTFTLAGAADEITGKLLNGELDIAALPTNVSATLYNKSEGNIQLLALNTLGILYIVTKGTEITSLEDLKGKTIYSTGQGALPEYAFNYILSQNGIDPETDVTVEFLSEHSELATKILSTEEPIIAVLPQPFVTQVTMKDENVTVALDLTEEWDKAVDGKSVISMGCLVVRKEFAENNKEAVNAFLEEYEASVNFANESTEEAAQLIEKYEIIGSAAMAQKAIPNCHIVYIDGDEMKSKTQDLFQVLFDANPKSIGGSLPDDDFYYQK